LNNSADVYLAAGTSFGLNFSGADVIDSLFLNRAAEPVGTYGAIGSGADFEMENFSGPGLLEVTRVGLLGDYNDDGAVNAADYTVWRNRLHNVAALANDGTRGVDFDDYTRWKSNYGHTAGSGSSVTLNAVVPEPAAIVLLLIGWLTIANSYQRQTLKAVSERRRDTVTDVRQGGPAAHLKNYSVEDTNGNG